MPKLLNVTNLFVRPASPVTFPNRKSGGMSFELAPFGRAFDPGVFQGLQVTTGTAKNRHNHFSSLEFGKAKFKVNDGFIDPHFTSAPGTAVVVLLRRGTKGNILPLLYLFP